MIRKIRIEDGEKIRDLEMEFKDKDLENFEDLCEDIFQEEIVPLTSLSYPEKEILLNSLFLIQNDALSEMYEILAIISPNKYDEYSSQYPRSTLENYFYENKSKIKFFICVLILNYFNRGDEILEDLTKDLDPETTPEELYDLASNIPFSWIGKGLTFKEVSADQYLEIIFKLVLIFDLDFNRIINLVHEIIYAGLGGFQMLSRKYTIDEALEYRRNTIGKYCELLGEIILEDQDQKNALSENLIFQQSVDDEHDVDEDLNSQVNPYIAFLNELGLDVNTDLSSILLCAEEGEWDKVEYFAKKTLTPEQRARITFFRVEYDNNFLRFNDRKFSYSRSSKES